MIIRKLSVGTDPLKAMHFQVGSFIMHDSHQIHLIHRTDDGFDIYITNGNKEVMKWKTINTYMPVIIEHSLDF